MEVNEVSNAMMKLQRLGEKQMATRCLQRLPDPPGPMHVSQAAWSFFHVGLELENSVPELPVANRLQSHQALQKAVAVLPSHLWKDLPFKLLCRLRISKQESRVEKGGVG